MKVGDYVRFKTLSREIKIGKVIDIIEPDKESMKKYCVYDLDNNEATVDDYIIKSSPNIIDLIEAGDYVNGKQVEWVGYDLYKEHNNGTLEGIGEKRVLFNSFTKDSVRQSGIKSIVTKEMYSSVEYRVENN
jgi:hypothetical protein